MASAPAFPIWATGRRKESIARVRIIPGTGRILINNKSVNDYFGGHVRARSEAVAPLQHSRNSSSLDFHVSVSGGGVSGQSGAVSLGIARGIVEIDPNLRVALRKEG